MAVVGATGLTGSHIVQQLVQAGCQVTALSRQAAPHPFHESVHRETVHWLRTGLDPLPPQDACIVTIPMWELPDNLDWLAACGAHRLVALSSTSQYSKASSPDPGERNLAARLVAGERRLQALAGKAGMSWVILRPTMIYGEGRDGNVSALIRFIRRYGFVPLLGQARGQRQPVHVADVAKACVAALDAQGIDNQAYDLSGGETLSFRQLCERIFAALGRKTRIVSIPTPLFRVARPLRHLLPTRLRWLVAMVERMNEDLICDNSAARHDLSFNPRPFVLDERDLRISGDRIARGLG